MQKVALVVPVVSLSLVGGLFVLALGMGQSLSAGSAEPPHVEAAGDLEAGRYVVIMGGCNDCHTPGYGPVHGEVPESLWLTGADTGFNGPWGTTYAANLRLTLSRMTEDQWVEYAHTFETRPADALVRAARDVGAGPAIDVPLRALAGRPGLGRSGRAPAGRDADDAVF